MSDLSTFRVASASEKGARCHLRNPYTGEKLDLWVDCVGRDSKAYRDESRRLQNDRFDAMRNGQKRLSREEVDDAASRLIAACVKDWNLVEDGKPIECTREEAVRVLGDPDYSWIFEQVDAFVQERSHFLS